ncbi:uncharacterized protein CTHT_0013930 [Thermochaetoides thermophila DSM 1495]|uniref:Nuclease S1-like protein n=1 Tax=Chaetomium thermophilum (strain DSM 1495 / CBS 144.50 / IMI 039719) TaxID=759272 RepID=G0S1K5_CHATD|nr:hypothetical protein CTHT_0013930 [Thermochaetoides thermophila DSM 1495]EGS22915.1 hypothetical protein CTHT_0013930 [Thermochaetoides thermophila DSM 1495]
MRLSSLAFGAAAVSVADAWGGFGHITIGYLASSLINPNTTTLLQTLLHNTTDFYLAGVATWADSVRYTKWGRFTSGFHFIDAKDNPPHSCNVDIERDCKQTAGCVVTALANYTTRLMDESLSRSERAIAAKFVVHFVGDLHQPLHNEDVARGGNGIPVLFDGARLNLHHVWDTSIVEKLVGGGRGLRRKPYEMAKRWAEELVREIEGGKFSRDKEGWLKAANLSDPVGTALEWAREGNSYVCSTVLPDGVNSIVEQELGGEYYQKAAPVVEAQIAKAGYRLAAWLDMITASLHAQALTWTPEERQSPSPPGDL